MQTITTIGLDIAKSVFQVHGPYQMDRYPGGQFPYAAFFWPALVAASAAETASSIAAHFLGFSGDAHGDHTRQEPEGATPSKIALELHAVRLRDFTVCAGAQPGFKPRAGRRLTRGRSPVR
jgi:hypothetical protein